MSKTILITGSTDGIGLETAKMLVNDGHNVILHGRSDAKLEAAKSELSQLSSEWGGRAYMADLSELAGIDSLAEALTRDFSKIDVLINNAGVYKTPNPLAQNGLDIRFMVNTIAPAVLTDALMPLLGSEGRVISLSSAAQAPVSLDALAGQVRVGDMDAYSQSKLALTMWSSQMAKEHPSGPVFIAVNPGSLLASKMVKEGFGVAGNDIRIGAEILSRLSLAPEAAAASGKYFDNDRGSFGPPHADGQNSQKSAAVTTAIFRTIDRLRGA